MSEMFASMIKNALFVSLERRRMFSLRQEDTAQKVHEMFLNSMEMSQSAHKEKGSCLSNNVHQRSVCV